MFSGFYSLNGIWIHVHRYASLLAVHQYISLSQNVWFTRIFSVFFQCGLYIFLLYSHIYFIECISMPVCFIPYKRVSIVAPSIAKWFWYHLSCIRENWNWSTCNVCVILSVFATSHFINPTNWRNSSFGICRKCFMVVIHSTHLPINYTCGADPFLYQFNIESNQCIL